MSFTLGEEPPLTLGEELQTARYRLYRSQILQQNMRWKALAEIYTMHSFAPVSNLKIFVKICIFFGKICQIFADFAGVPHPGCYFLEPIVKFRAGLGFRLRTVRGGQRAALGGRSAAAGAGGPAALISKSKPRQGQMSNS